MVGKYSDRICETEALALLETASTAELMAIAAERRRELHGRRTFYVHSHNLNPTNICENRCKLCAFWRERDADDAYVVTLEKIPTFDGMAATDGKLFISMSDGSLCCFAE